MLFMNTAMPLTGAPGAVLLYGLIGAIAWPNNRPGGTARGSWRPHRMGHVVARDGLAMAAGGE